MSEEFLPRETIHHIKEGLDELKERVKDYPSKDIKSAMDNLAGSINRLLDIFTEAAEGAEKEESSEKQMMARINALEDELASIKGTSIRPSHVMIPPPEFARMPKPSLPKPPMPFPKPFAPPPMPSLPRPQPRPEPLKIQPSPFSPFERQPMLPPRFPERQMPPLPQRLPPQRFPERPMPLGPMPGYLPRFEEPIPTIQLEEEPPRKPGFFSKMFGKKEK